MKKFIISIEAVDGKQHEFEIEYKKTVTVSAIENSIQAREARFFRFGDCMVNLDNVFSLVVKEKKD
ncbi:MULTISPECIES: hypothetical protein [Bacillus cereus group]|uniref:Uncharacterized protein n=1 Tax=Bacillus cereus TaxID=1396 RepID=A0A2B1K7K1_BACCE|nr:MULTISPECIES: hypothetical protein [Bacillus cereus group]EJS67115.1 hypothetical protein ICU_03185 [Bacillus cereus BAG2X1-1]MDM5238568.1 hypothetical protein [Bacillus cereus]PEA08393.1 hypothetical protein CON38_18320 [Bacillus cereus]PEC23762.1 hypothetical protein COM96_00690 [Bacillus cereus]PFN19418.1 hypothetical protein COJ50_24405 [Bacillus cereus]